MENPRIWLSPAKKGLDACIKIWYYVHMEIWYTQDTILYWFRRLPDERVQYYTVLGGHHHWGSFCCFLEAIKKTHEVTTETSLHLLKFSLDEQILITMTDIVFSNTKFPEKKKIKNFQEHNLNWLKSQ